MTTKTKMIYLLLLNFNIVILSGCDSCNEEITQPAPGTNPVNAVKLYSSNGGVNWSSKEISYSDILKSVTSINDSTFFVAGSTGDGDGTILITTNFGNNWYERHSFVHQKQFKSICGLTNTKLIAICSEGSFDKIFITTNSGTNWQGVTDITGLNSMYFINSLEGVCVGDLGIIYRSTNGGYNWYQVPSPTSSDLYDVSFYNQIGYAVGALGRIIKTSDGGENWTQLNNIPLQSTLHGVEFAGNFSNVIAVGSGGTILRTSNSGDNWSAIEPMTNSFLNDIAYYYMGTILIAAGSDGKILRSTNLGLAWSSINGVTTRNLYGVYFDDYGGCHIVGD